MNTAVKTKNETANDAKSSEQPKRLSKAGQFMRDNPGGIFEYVDRRAINRMRR
jgi:hypothetical protein